jgi:hypothetical protein
VAGAAVKAKTLDTGFERTTAARNGGEFEVPLLLAERHEVTVEAKGLAPFTQTGVVVNWPRPAR